MMIHHSHVGVKELCQYLSPWLTKQERYIFGGLLAKAAKVDGQRQTWVGVGDRLRPLYSSAWASIKWLKYISAYEPKDGPVQLELPLVIYPSNIRKPKEYKWTGQPIELQGDPDYETPPDSDCPVNQRKDDDVDLVDVYHQTYRPSNDNMDGGVAIQITKDHGNVKVNVK